jgi:hypothetical protein
VRGKLLIALAVVTPLGFATKLAPGLEAPWIRFYAGGALYEIFWVLLVLALAPRWPPVRVAFGVLIATSALEVLQLWSSPLLEAIRGTFLGRTLIGSTFSWWDFPIYLLGCGLAVVLVHRLERQGRPRDASSRQTGRVEERSYPRSRPGGVTRGER